MSDQDQPADTTCVRCRRAIDCCAICEATDCHECICYRCLIVSLGHSKAHPHDHGG